MKGRWVQPAVQLKRQADTTSSRRPHNQIPSVPYEAWDSKMGVTMDFITERALIWNTADGEKRFRADLTVMRVSKLLV